MALDWVLAIAHSGHAFGTIQCDVGDCLYMALEDSPRRLLERSFYLWHERYRLRQNRMTGAGEALPKLHRPYIVSALFS